MRQQQRLCVSSCIGLLCWVLVMATSGSVVGAADWYQWRGPERNGVVNDSPPLMDSFPKEGLEPVWRSKPIAGDTEGGWASPIVAHGKVYVYSNWKTHVPFDQRTLTAESLDQLAWVPGISEGLAEKVEAARLSEERKQQTSESVRDWAGRWVKANLPEEAREHEAVFQRRLQSGEKAVAGDVCRKLETILDREFPNQAQLNAWYDEQQIDAGTRKAIGRTIRTEDVFADDVLVCLDAETGKVVWERKFPGNETQFPSSASPCISDGRCYLQGSGGKLYCVDAATGRDVWQRTLKGDMDRTLSSSFVVEQGIAVLLAGKLMGLDAGTGETVWEQDAAGGYYASPAYWRTGGKTYLVCNGWQEAVCVEVATGNVLWSVPGGGSATPAIFGNRMVLCTNKADMGTLAYELNMQQPKKLWQVDFIDRGASALAADGYVYIIGGGGKGRALCVDLNSGAVLWERKLPGADFCSPVLADGKLLHIVKKMLYVIEADPTGYNLVGRVNAGTCRCTSVALVDGMAYVRLEDGVACYDLRERR